MISVLLSLVLQSSTPEIIVSGRRLERAHAECVERGCTPLRDAQATIAVAEEQYLQGAYVKAKRTLAAGVARNRQYAGSDPKPVAALYEAYATVALHEGDKDLYRRAVAGQVRTLRDNLPPSDPAVADAALATGDMWVTLGNVRSADAAYRSAEQRANAQGQKTVALVAGLRRAGLMSSIGRTDRANDMLTAIASQQAAQDPIIQSILPVVRLRLASRRADDAEIDRLLAKVFPNVADRPMLIWAPPYEANAGAASRNDARRWGVPDPAGATSSEQGSIQWADVGFWIRPDGRTADIEVLRGRPAGQWIRPAIAQIGGRRYTVRPDSPPAQGVYRIERFTLRGTYRVPSSSLIRRRAGPAELEVLDLTDPAAPTDKR